MKRSKLYRSKKWNSAEVANIGAHLEEPSYFGTEVMFSVIKDFEWLGCTKWYSVHGNVYKRWKATH